MPDKPTLAYLTSFYPHAADTFIRNEVRSLRDLGFAVHTFSVRRPSAYLAVSEDIRQERSNTRYLLAKPWQLLVAGVLMTLLCPTRMMKAARLVFRCGPSGIKPRLWQLAYLFEASLLARELQKLGVKHLHNHIGENSATVAMLASVLTGIPYSMTVHGPGDFDRPVTIALGEKIRQAAFVIGITEFGRSQLYRWCGHEHWSKIHVVHCGLDATFLSPSIQPFSQSRRFVCIGRLCEQKGQLLLLEAAARLVAEGAVFELVFIGDGPMRGEIEGLIRRHHLEGHVKLAGWMSSPQVREQLLGSRAMVLPSFAEGLPMVIMEALALCRPVITTYIAGIPELVTDRVTGWLVPAGSVDALVGAMRQALAAKSEQLEQMGQVGRERVLERHDVAKEARKLASLFKESSECAAVSRSESRAAVL